MMNNVFLGVTGKDKGNGTDITVVSGREGHGVKQNHGVKKKESTPQRRAIKTKALLRGQICLNF